MTHTFLVTPQSLHHFADTGEDVRGAIPELVFRLLATSVPDAVERRIPFGRDVNQSGVDGFLETPTGFREFVPSGRSFWEIGTGKDPRAKANADYNLRTESNDVANKGDFTLVLVSPRTRAEGWSENEQDRWIEAKKVEGPWKNILVIDGTKLCHWLAFNPSIDAWLAERMRIVRGAITSPVTHWENIQSRGDRPLSAEIFTIARDAPKDEVLKVLKGELRELRLRTLQPREVVDFVVAVLASQNSVESASLTGRSILVESSEAWKDLCELPDSHVLIPHGSLDIADQGADLLALALRKGHRVILPTSRPASGTQSVVALATPKKFELKSALQRAGFTETRARQLSEQAAGSPSRLLRVLSGLPDTPPWANGEQAALLAPAMLAGRWDDKAEEERRVLTTLFGRNYEGWVQSAAPLCLFKDPPLQNRDTQWRFTSIFEAWYLLGSSVLPNDIERFQNAALEVLGERHPALSLPVEDRWAAAIHEKEQKFSSKLREGLAEVLALMAVRPEPLSRLAPSVARRTAENVVRQLLASADWELWASLNDILPLFAEAVPTTFLICVAAALDATPSPIRTLFDQESSGITGRNYLTGLWWSLEALAWSEAYLAQVALLLCRCAELDPGGNWANRPANSLADIFLPWHPQTSASIEKRAEVVALVARSHPQIGWQLLLGLLPKSHAFTSGNYKPQWRELVSPEWDDKVTAGDYWRQVETYTRIAIEMARSDSHRLVELIQRIHDLTPNSRDIVLNYLRSGAVQHFEDSVKLPLWDALLEIVTKHRKFRDADWALPETEVSKLASAAENLRPQSAFVRHQRLFVDRDFDLYEEKGNYEEQRAILERARADAVAELLAEGGLPRVLAFAKVVASPWKVGLSLAQHGRPDLDAGILPELLTGDREPLYQIARNYVLGRFSRDRYHWVDAIPLEDWRPSQKAQLYSVLPFQPETWQRAAQKLRDDVSEYWNIAQANPFDAPEHMIFGAEQLLQHGRPAAALSCLEELIREKRRLPSELLLRILEALLSSKETPRALDSYLVTEAFTALQNDVGTDNETLMKLEWEFLPLLNRHSGGAPKTLEHRLATDPSFFCKVIRTLFKSDNQSELEEVTEREKDMAMAAYKLLEAWHTIPGEGEDGSINVDALNHWLSEVKRMCGETGHLGSALDQVGRVCAYHGVDRDGLWLPKAVAAVLDEPNHGRARHAFIIEKRNLRGGHTWTAGKDEREFGRVYRLQAESAELAGFRNLGGAMRELASWYDEDAEREAARDPYED